MSELLWEPDVEPAGPLTSAVAERLVRAVGAGRAAGLFPPVAGEGPGGVCFPVRDPSGPTDARLIAVALGQKRFTPFIRLLGEVDRWSRGATRRHADTLAPGVLDVENGALFGPLLRDTFLACAAGSPSSESLADTEFQRIRDFLTVFLRRLARDLSSSWPDSDADSDSDAWRGPVVGLSAHGFETHNGRQRVLRLRLAGGAEVAYKPRPASGESLFAGLSPTESVFALLNELPPTSGPVRLPVMRSWRGQGRDQHAYTWLEWIAPPRQWGELRRAGDFRLQGMVLDPGPAKRFWHRAGSLTAACFAFGIVDLFEGNLLVCAREDGEPMYFPIDLEIYFAAVGRLSETGLLPDPGRGTPHVGLADEPRWDGLDGPVAVFRADGDGVLRLYRRRERWGRTETRTVVGDSAGQVGYGPYILDFLRGMFDVWTLMCRHRERVADALARGSVNRFVRVLLQSTHEYTDLLADRVLSGVDVSPVGLADPEEARHLERLDVPYFFRAATAGPVLTMEPPPRPFRGIPVTADVGAALPPVDEVRRAAGLDLGGLGVALRDVVENVRDRLGTVPLHTAQTRLALHDGGGECAFSWPQAGRWLVYTWHAERVRLRLEPIDP